MFRRASNSKHGKRTRAALAAAMAFIGVLTTSVHADEVAAFLEEQGLNDLLAVHLEQELASASESDRRSLIRKLASLYATLLSQQTDAEARASLEARAHLLLEQTDASEAMDLRLALAQATYRQIEHIAEQHRLRAATADDVARAETLATQLAGELKQTHDKLEAQLELTMRKLGRAAGSESIVLAEQSEFEARLLDQATYLLAWTLYYQGWLTHDKKPADVAEGYFAEILGTDSPKPAPEDVSIDIRANEPMARAILGMALCRSLTRSATTALQWIDLLEHPRTAAAVRNEVGAWRLVVLLEHGEFKNVAQLAAALPGGLGAAPTPWLRLIAAWSLEAGAADASAIRLAQQAMTSLAARGALDHLIQLAERYGTESLGSTGFAPLYVQAVLGFQNVRERHPGDKPSGDQATQQRFAEVGKLFERAVAQPDASQYAEPAANARLLAAWCLYFQSDFLSAAEAFERASKDAALAEPSEALWMSIVSLDHLLAAGDNAALSRRMLANIDRYLDEYPAGKHVPELLLRRSYSDKPTPEAIAALLSVPPESKSYMPSRERAAAMLYKQFRSASADQRAGLAREFLAVQKPLLAAELASALPAPQGVDGPKQLVIRCRQVLDAATTSDVRDVAAASEALDVLASLDEAGYVPGELDDELLARRAQVALLSGEMSNACSLADELWARSPNTPWARVANRSIFHELLVGRRTSDFPELDRDTLELIARYGGRVIQEFAGEASALARPEAMTFHVIVAEAVLELWRRTNEPQRLEAALFLFERLLERRPNDARFLRVTAELAGANGDIDRALECWRVLLAGLEPGSNAWYEAKFNHVNLLRQLDPVRALDVLRQHVQLQGDYGPPPWGEKLRKLHDALEASAPPSEPAEDAP